MSVLQELWRGNISPTDRFVRPGSDFKKISVEVCNRMDSLMETLTPEGKKQMEDIDNLRHDMIMLAEEDAFIYGFRLGAKLIMEIVGSYKGQFYSPQEQ